VRWEVRAAVFVCILSVSNGVQMVYRAESELNDLTNQVNRLKRPSALRVGGGGGDE
jgi:hypothetical protein